MQATADLYERHRGRLETCLVSFEHIALNTALRVPPGLTPASELAQPVRYACRRSPVPSLVDTASAHVARSDPIAMPDALHRLQHCGS